MNLCSTFHQHNNIPCFLRLNHVPDAKMCICIFAIVCFCAWNMWLVAFARLLNVLIAHLVHNDTSDRWCAIWEKEEGEKTIREIASYRKRVIVCQLPFDAPPKYTHTHREIQSTQLKKLFHWLCGVFSHSPPILICIHIAGRQIDGSFCLAYQNTCLHLSTLDSSNIQIMYVFSSICLLMWYTIHLSIR